MFDVIKSRAKALKLAIDYNKRDNAYLNNLLSEIKIRNSISDDDWIQISTAFSVLTAKEIISKGR